ncbi:ABC transporter ATP-binding protein [Dactylosporangium maewongense]|uniref:ABC transporter ATP-binding protein n=1 Tax=Dactylosporangium maewongense TaxID=634393 RepID=A0ABP4PBV5_9ACTN
MSTHAATTVTSILSVDTITVRFAGLTALDNVSFEVADASVHAVIGPNGAGKSTLFNVISGVYSPDAGTVRFNGTDLTSRAPHAIARLGIARTFQNIALLNTESVEDNLLLGRHLLTRTGFVAAGLRLPRSRNEERRHRARVREIAAFVGLAERLDIPVGTLPYGDQKRVEIARALCLEPALLLLDEPAAGMNAHETAGLAHLVRDIRDELEIPILLIEHDMGLVMGIADRVSVLDFGRLIADGTPNQIQRDPEVQRAYLGVDGAEPGVH